MKKVFAFVAVVATLSFASCGGNKNTENTEAVAETEAVVEDATVIEQDSVQVNTVAADSVAVEGTTPAAN